MNQVLNERDDLLNAVFGKILRDIDFHQISFSVSDGSFTSDIGLL